MLTNTNTKHNSVSDNNIIHHGRNRKLGVHHWVGARRWVLQLRESKILYITCKEKPYIKRAILILFISLWMSFRRSCSCSKMVKRWSRPHHSRTSRWAHYYCQSHRQGANRSIGSFDFAQNVDTRALLVSRDSGHSQIRRRRKCSSWSVPMPL